MTDLVALTGLELNQHTTQPEFDALWPTVADYARGHHQTFILGDYMNAGDHLYGSTWVAEKLGSPEARGLAEGTIANARWLAAKIPPHQRRRHLSVTHHLHVAALNEAERSELLDRCESEGLTVRHLKQIVKDRDEELHAPPVDDCPNNPPIVPPKPSTTSEWVITITTPGDQEARTTELINMLLNAAKTHARAASIDMAVRVQTRTL